MQCKTARSLFPFLRSRGELPPDDAQSLEHHVANCPECRATVDFERSFDQAIGKAMNEIAIPNGLRDAIQARIAQENARVWRRGLARISAIAAGLVIVLSIGLGWWHSRIEVSPEQFAQDEDVHFVLESGRSIESAEEFFRMHNVRVELPRDFDYSLLQALDLVEIKGKFVARLEFVRGDARAKVFVLPKRDFRLVKNAPLEVMGSRCTLELIDASPEFLFVIVYSGEGANHQRFVPQGVVG